MKISLKKVGDFGLISPNSAAYGRILIKQKTVKSA